MPQTFGPTTSSVKRLGECLREEIDRVVRSQQSIRNSTPPIRHPENSRREQEEKRQWLTIFR